MEMTAGMIMKALELAWLAFFFDLGCFVFVCVFHFWQLRISDGIRGDRARVLSFPSGS
jgi:hypothetical protein